METNKILTADVLDIIFEGKNKAYGAYQLRKGYSRTLSKAMVITGSTLLLALGGTVLANIIDKDSATRYNTVETTMVHVNADAPPPPPPPPPLKQQNLDLKQIQFTPPVIVNDKDVKPEEIIKEIELDAAISTVNVQSNNTVQIVQAPVEDNNTKVLEIKKADDENEIQTFVQIEAGFPGGQDAWLDYLRNNLRGDVPVDNGASAGKYTVMVKFVVNKEGSLSDIQCENDPGFGMCAEAIRVIKKTKNWTPAMNNGKNVNAYRRQPITFVVED